MALTSSRSFAESTGIGMLSNGVVRRGALAVWDIVCWTLGAAFVIGLRYSFRINEVQWESVLRYLAISWVLLVGIGVVTKFYRGRFLVGSFDEAFGLALHFLGVAAITVVTTPLLNDALPRSLPVLAPPIALVGAAAGRWLYRAVRHRGARRATTGAPRPHLRRGRRRSPGAQPAAHRPHAPLPPRRLPRRQPRQAPPAHPGCPGRRLRRSLADAAADLDAAAVVLAVPGRVRRPRRPGAAAGRGGRPRRLRPPAPRRALGGQVRPPTSVPSRSATSSAGTRSPPTSPRSPATSRGKRVLITGAGGSIGSELAARSTVRSRRS